MLKTRCVIICSGEIKKSDIEKADLSESDFVICADGGYDHAVFYTITPDVVLGDFDSITSYIPNNIERKKFPVQKDDTDSLIALKYGVEKGYNYFLLLGALGGRLDHTIANMQCLFQFCEKGKNVKLIGAGSVLYGLKNGSLVLEPEDNAGFSVFSLTARSDGVSIQNAAYPLANVELTSSYPLGVSNKFCGGPATVSVKNGCLLIVTYTLEKTV